MMTVVCLGRRRQSLVRFQGSEAPITWSIPIGVFPFRASNVPQIAPGSAKPGRGGRRKRKAERAKIRVRIGRCVEQRRWPLRWSRKIVTIVYGPPRALTMAEIMSLVRSTPLILPAGFDLQFLEPTRHPGRRERRRRAKLRRRRALRERRAAARSFLFALPPFYRPSCPLALWRAIDRAARRLRPSSPTPGA